MEVFKGVGSLVFGITKADALTGSRYRPFIWSEKIHIYTNYSWERSNHGTLKIFCANDVANPSKQKPPSLFYDSWDWVIYFYCLILIYNFRCRNNDLTCLEVTYHGHQVKFSICTRKTNLRSLLYLPCLPQLGGVISLKHNFACWIQQESGETSCRHHLTNPIRDPEKEGNVI